MRVRLGQKLRGAGTLVEVVIATIILSILGAGIMGSVNYGLFSMRLTRENQRATQIMLEKTEAIRLYDWDQVISNGFIPTSFTNYYDPQSPSNPGTVYIGTITITNPTFSVTPPSYVANLREVIVALNWTTMGNITHARELHTYIAKDGLQNYIY